MNIRRLLKFHLSLSNILFLKIKKLSQIFINMSRSKKAVVDEYSDEEEVYSEDEEPLEGEEVMELQCYMCGEMFEVENIEDGLPMTVPQGKKKIQIYFCSPDCADDAMGSSEGE